MPDWKVIKAEYVSTEIGYRDLAKKYGVPFSTLQKHAKKDGWPACRRQLETELVTAVTTAVIDESVDRAVRVRQAADNLLSKIELTIENINGYRSARSVKDVADALKVCKDIMELKTKADIEEQELRLEKLRKDMAAGEQSKDVTVTIEGDAGKWCD